MFPRHGIDHLAQQRVPSSADGDRRAADFARCPQELAMLLRLGAVVAIIMAVTASLLWIAA